jgi:hypothetical protein
MDPRAMVSHLLMDVGVAGWGVRLRNSGWPGHCSPTGQPSTADQKLADSSDTSGATSMNTCSHWACSATNASEA